MSETKLVDNSADFLKELDNAIVDALEIIGGMAETYAKASAPVDTGNLRNSITHQVENDEDEKAVEIGTNVEYAIFQELGTSKGVKPKHFLYNSVNNHIPQYQRVLSGEIGKIKYIKK